MRKYDVCMRGKKGIREMVGKEMLPNLKSTSVYFVLFVMSMLIVHFRGTYISVRLF